MRLKVLFIPCWYPSQENKVQGTFVQEHVKAAGLYDDVAVLFGKPTRGLPTLLSALEDGVPTFRFFFPDIRLPETCWLSYTYGVLRAFRRVKEEWGVPDVIHAQEPSPAFASLMLRLFHGIPYVVSEHVSAFPLRTIGPGQATLARLAFPRAQRVLGVNKNFIDDFRHYGIKCDFRWLPNSIDNDIFFLRTNKSRKPLIVHCSRFHEIKRVPDLIQAFARCQQEFPGVHLDLIGDGEGRPDVEELAKKFLRPGSFTFYGVQTKVFLAERMREASAFALPSAYETFGSVLIEAMACGTPVIATRVGGIPAIVNKETGILVEPGNIEALAMAIKSVLNGEEKFDHKAISTYAEQQFSKKVVGRILHEEHLRAAVKGNSMRPGSFSPPLD